MSDNRSAAAVAMLCVVVINTKNTKLRAVLDQLDQEEKEEIVQSTAHLCTKNYILQLYQVI